MFRLMRAVISRTRRITLKKMMSSSAGQKDIILDLLKNNICKYCILRFLNEKNCDFYHNIDNHFAKLLDGKTVDEPPESKKPKLNPCSVCLGLLQRSDDPEFINKIVDSVCEGNYDSDNVTFALSLPIAFLLRNRSLWLYLTNKYLEYFLDKYDSHEIKQEFMVVSVKEVWKWLSAQKIANKLYKVANNGVTGNFHVNINIKYVDEDMETSCLFKMFPEEYKYRSNHKRKFHGELLTRKRVEIMLMDTNANIFEGNYPIPPDIPTSFVECQSIECCQDSIYIAGRYNKLSRNLSQTPWMIHGERRMESSVEEKIEKPISKAIPNSGVKFSSSGREDVDVRTLGKGRPFVVDICNPRRTKIDSKILREVEKEINESTEDIFVRDLQLVQKEDLVHIKDGEESKTKTYTCFCLLKLNSPDEIPQFKEQLKKLSEIKDLIVQQRTPVRVLHRRPLAVRPKTIYWMNAQFHEVINNQFFFKLSLKVGAGTYIKEFVHGDFGRSSPNLSEILNRETDILALDVEEVALNWPPSLDYDEIKSPTPSSRPDCNTDQCQRAVASKSLKEKQRSDRK